MGFQQKVRHVQAACDNLKPFMLLTASEGGRMDCEQLASFPPRPLPLVS